MEKGEGEVGKAGDGGDPVLFSDKYYAVQKAKCRGLSLIKVTGQLKLQMFTERITHGYISELLGNVKSLEEGEIESLSKLLAYGGADEIRQCQLAPAVYTAGTYILTPIC